ncbi:MAG: hypothetical protein AAF458_25045 [Pseudomonadota bacterium]
MTLLLTHVPPHWRIDSAEPLEAAPGVDAAPGWLMSRGVTRVAAEPAPIVTFSAGGVERFVFISRQFGLRSSDMGKRPALVRVRVEVRAGELMGEAPHWPPTGVMVHNVDERGKRLWYWPYMAVGSDGSHGWQQLDGVMPIAAGTDELRVLAYVLADSGQVQMRRLVVESAAEHAGYAAMRLLVWAGWSVLAIAAIGFSLRYRARLYAGLVVLGLSIVITLAGVTPQPLMAGLVKSVSFTTQDLFADAGERLAELTEPTGPAAWPADDASPNLVAPSEESGNTLPSDGEPHRPDTVEQATDDRHRTAQTRPAGTAPPKPVRPPRVYWEPAFSLVDKLAHLGAFLLLTLVGAYAWPTLPAWRLIVCVLALSASIQLVQHQLITREADALDFAADSLGVLAGALLRYATLAVRRTYLKARV